MNIPRSEKFDCGMFVLFVWGEMVKSIQFKQVNCRNCYKCVRNCPVKSIAVKDEQSQILEDECILCGACLTVCPQNAKSMKSDLSLVNVWMREGYRVCMTIAPSYAAAFDVPDPGSLLPAMKKLGFHYAEETALGAALVSREYARLMGEGEMDNIISTCCPTIVSLVEKYYPELILYLAPVISPMIASARRIKDRFGRSAKVVFVGPCLSKHEECQSFGDNSVDAVLTFSELANMMEQMNVKFEPTKDAQSDDEIALARNYPLPGGVIGTIPESARGKYQCVAIDGVARVAEVLESLKSGEMKGFFIEANSCIGGCINGPCMMHPKGGWIEEQARMQKYHKACGSTPELGLAPEMSRSFADKKKRVKAPSDAEIRAILTEIGKPTEDKELNCGSCGYQTCKQKAEAVYLGNAELHMCLPYMRERAENLSNLMVDVTPNGIFVLDDELKISDMNAAAEKMVRTTKSDAIGCHIFEYLICDDFEHVLENGDAVRDRKFVYEEYGLSVYQTVLLVPEQNSLLVLLRDVTQEEEQRERLENLRRDTIVSAQRVIDKQMSVAQEIASLLGETAAETKIALSKLKESIANE